MDEKLTDKISLYLYNELDEEQRGAFEADVERSTELAEAVENERRFLLALGAREPARVPEALLAECRHDLMREVYRSERPAEAPGAAGPLARIFGSLSGMKLAWQPALAAALLALGFWGGRSAENFFSSDPPSIGKGAIEQASNFALPVSKVADIRSVELGPGGDEVRIVIEERRTIVGSPSDPLIRRLLISTIQGSNSGARLESLDVLRLRTEDVAVRRALVRAMLEDANPGMRLQALDALSPYSATPEVHRALVEAMRRDDNPGVRVQAIDLLTENPDRELVGLLQELVRIEPNNYVRLRCRRVLEELNASVDQF